MILENDGGVCACFSHTDTHITWGLFFFACELKDRRVSARWCCFVFFPSYLRPKLGGIRVYSYRRLFVDLWRTADPFPSWGGGLGRPVICVMSCTHNP